jgi:hypothetical protein
VSKDQQIELELELEPDETDDAVAPNPYLGENGEVVEDVDTGEER